MKDYSTDSIRTSTVLGYSRYSKNMIMTSETSMHLENNRKQQGVSNDSRYPCKSN